MKLEKVFCPNCGGNIKGDLTKDAVFCPYCGQQLAIDHERNEIIITNNYNETKHVVDEAEIAKVGVEHFKAKKIAELDDKEFEKNRTNSRLVMIGIIISFAIACLSQLLSGLIDSIFGYNAHDLVNSLDMISSLSAFMLIALLAYLLFIGIGSIFRRNRK